MLGRYGSRLELRGQLKADQRINTADGLGRLGEYQDLDY